MPREVLEKIVVARDPALAWRDGRELGIQILKGDDLRCLPASVDPAFRNPRNYDAAGRLLKSEVSCSSFAINDFHNPYYGGSWQGTVGAHYAVCDVAERQFLIVNDKFRSAYAKLEPEHGPSCPSGSYMIVPYARGGRFSPHVLRQLPSGQFAHVTGKNGGQVQLFYSRRAPDHDYEPITRYADLPNGGELNRCKAICIQPRSTALPSQSQQSAPQGGRLGLAGRWDAVRQNPENDRHGPLLWGLRCGTYTVGVTLEFGLRRNRPLPNGGYISGPDAMVLNVRTTARSFFSREVEAFRFSGVHALLWAKRSASDPSTLVFKDVYQRPPIPGSRAETQRLPSVVDVSKGIVISILETTDDSFRARVQWDSPCSSELLFHRTSPLPDPAQAEN